MAYDTADYYDARGDIENLAHGTPEEAIEDILDSWADPGCDMVALIREHSPVSVEAFARDAVPVWQAERWAERMVEDVAEWFSEEYGDPDGSGDDWPSASLKRLEKAIAGLIQDELRDVTVWRCSPCGRRNYTADEVEAMMRKCCPEWFTPPPESPPPADEPAKP